MGVSVVLRNRDATASKIGEVRSARGVTVGGIGVSSIRTASFKVRFDDPRFPAMRQGGLLVSIYEDAPLPGQPDRKLLRFNGELDSGNLVAQGASDDGMTFQASDPFGVFLAGAADRPGRLVGKGVTPGAGAGTAFSGVERAQIAKQMIDSANAESNTWIRIGTIDTTAVTTTGGWYFKPIGEAVTELALALNGFEWELVPVEPYVDAGGLVLATFNARNSLGSLKPDVVFTYGHGTGKSNLASYGEVWDYRILNKAYALPPSWPDAAPAPDGEVGFNSDAASIASAGLREQVVSQDLPDFNLRFKLAQQHVLIRKTPRALVTLGSHVYDPQRPYRVPRFGFEYSYGDTITARARLDGQDVFDGLVRVYNGDVAWSDVNGQQAATLRTDPQ